MRVLIACEFSGIVRDAFVARGHDAWSCDLISTEKPGQHFTGDVFKIINDGWDLMIAHPPCTYLTYAGNAHWNKPGRDKLRSEAMEFFLRLWNAPIERICLENPFGLPCQAFRKPSQKIDPFNFGEPVRKRICLWLKNLPLLFTSNDLFPSTGIALPPPDPIYIGVRIATGKPKKRYAMETSPRRWHWTEAQSSSHKDRQKERSRFFHGIAQAMAEQWGNIPPNDCGGKGSRLKLLRYAA